MPKFNPPDPDGKLEVKFTLGKDGMLESDANWTPKNVNRDREIGPPGNGTDVERKMTIANKYELGDTEPSDPSLGVPGGNTSTYYPHATHRPVVDTSAQYAHLTSAGLMDGSDG